MRQNIRIVTGAATLIGSEDVIIFNSAVDINFNLGPAYGDGRKFECKNINSGIATLLPDSGETIASGASVTLYQNESLDVMDYIAGDWAVREYREDTVTDTITERTAGSGVTIDGLLIKDGLVDGYDIGAAATPVARTNNPIVGTNAINTNIDKLDAAIGADPTPVARTTGPIAAANAVNANIDALDSAIGFEGQMSGTPHVVTFPTTIFQALDKLDTYKSVQTIKKTIGGVGVEGCDFNFATAEDQAEQVIDLGEIIPAFAKVFHAMTVTEATFTGATTLAATTGVTSSGDELIASGGILTKNDITEPATGSLSPVGVTAAAKHIYLSATPGANWSAVTAGKVSVYITFINFTNI